MEIFQNIIIVNAICLVIVIVITCYNYHCVVVPVGVADIFTIDPLSGVLTIKAQGPGLVPAGVDAGTLTVCTYYY